jgi:excisionase family DNA binding protein
MIGEETPRPMLTVDQAARELGLKESTVRDWVLRRKLAYVRLSPRCIRIPSKEVARLLREGTVPAREPRPQR